MVCTIENVSDKWRVVGFGMYVECRVYVTGSRIGNFTILIVKSTILLNYVVLIIFEANLVASPTAVVRLQLLLVTAVEVQRYISAQHYE